MGKDTQTEGWIKVIRGESIMTVNEAFEACRDKLDEVTKGFSTGDFLEVLTLLSQEIGIHIEECALGKGGRG